MRLLTIVYPQCERLDTTAVRDLVVTKFCYVLFKSAHNSREILVVLEEDLQVLVLAQNGVRREADEEHLQNGERGWIRVIVRMCVVGHEGYGWVRVIVRMSVVGHQG